MRDWTATDRRIVMWAAMFVSVIVVVYILVGLIGMTARPPGLAALSQIDPYLAILEILLSLAALDFVILMTGIYAYASGDRKTFALIALAFAIAFAVLTCGVHFASLTVGRQLHSTTFPFAHRQLSFGEWPTVALSLDLLAWDFFLGLSLAFASGVFQGGGLKGRVRVSMIAAACLCLAGTLGPASGKMQIQYVGIAGYILALPVACTLLAMLFRQGITSESS